MSVKGSAARYYTTKLNMWPKTKNKIMKDSLDMLQEIIVADTPRITGDLQRSIKTKRKYKGLEAHQLYGEVYSKLYYAPAVEYGLRDHIKKSKPGKGMKLPNGMIVKEVHIRAHPGKHMFQSGALQFEYGGLAKAIYEKHLDDWAKDHKKGRR